MFDENLPPSRTQVAERFFAKGGAPLARARIASIERCVNPMLWRAYARRRRAIALARLNFGGASLLTPYLNDAFVGVDAEAASSGTASLSPAVERYLFHGASRDVIDVVLRSGTDFRVANMGGLMGACTYFADQSSYSHQYSCMATHGATGGVGAGRGGAAAAARTGGDVKMLLCRVALGDCTTGKSGMRRPPENSASGRLYDSVSNRPGEVANVASEGFMFGIFDNDACYPEYCITYSLPAAGAGGAADPYARATAAPWQMAPPAGVGAAFMAQISTIMGLAPGAPIPPLAQPPARKKRKHKR